jgi:glutathione S-transferase
MRLPVLYSFRRCPYAMRARLALDQAGEPCVLREVDLKAKPAEMLAASRKATVPVLVRPDGTVLEESLDIMLWALGRNDPLGWLVPETGRLQDMLALIDDADGPFKDHLDRFKYHVRYHDVDRNAEWRGAVAFLEELEVRLGGGALFGNRPTLADMAIFPFVRQLANSDRALFDALPLPRLERWLEEHVLSQCFQRVMQKRPAWRRGDEEVIAFAV